jgi:hypothetical protein
MINLSNKAAKRFHINWKDLEERSGDFWRVDVVMIGRTPMLFIVHEYTLFTFVRPKSQFRDLQSLSGEINNASPWYKGEKSLSLGKNWNRKLTGSINEMKRMTVGLYAPEQINAMEMSINQGLFSYLTTKPDRYLNPFEAVESYAEDHTPWL